MWKMRRKPDTNESSFKAFELSVELSGIGEQLFAIERGLRTLGLVPGKVDIPQLDAASRKKALHLMRKAEGLYKRGKVLKAQIEALGVNVDDPGKQEVNAQ